MDSVHPSIREFLIALRKIKKAQQINRNYSPSFTDIHTMISPSILTFVVAISHLAQPSTAQWQAGKGAQVNWYGDSNCGQFQSSATVWWDRFPRVSDYTAYSDEPECLSLNPSGNAKSVNVAAMWKQNNSSSSYGICNFFDGYGCTGSVRTGTHNPGTGQCLPARSSSGNYLWKSAKCWVRY